MTLQPRAARRPFEVELPPAPYPGLRPFERRVADLLRPRTDDRRGHHAPDPPASRGGPRRFGLRQELADPRRRAGAARAGARPRRRRTGAPATMLPREAPLAEPGQGARRPGRRRAPTGIASTRSVARLNLGRDAPAALAELLRRGDDDHICILVDQFEELFSFARQHGRDEAQLFVDILVGLQQNPPAGPLRHRDHALGVPGRLRAVQGLRRGGQPDPVSAAADGAAGAAARDPRAGDAVRRRGQPRAGRAPDRRRRRRPGPAAADPARADGAVAARDWGGDRLHGLAEARAVPPRERAEDGSRASSGRQRRRSATLLFSRSPSWRLGLEDYRAPAASPTCCPSTPTTSWRRRRPIRAARRSSSICSGR